MSMDDRVYIWRTPRDYPEDLVAMFDRSSSVEEHRLKVGQPVGEEIIRFTAEVSTEQIGSSPVIGNSTGIPLVDPAMSAALTAEAGEQLQLLPTTVVCRNGVVTDHKLVVVTKRVAGIDHSRSDLGYLKGTRVILSVRRLVLLPEFMAGLKIARLAELEPLLLLSSCLAKKLVETVRGDLGVYPLADVYPPG